jgi:hypothetical protein
MLKGCIICNKDAPMDVAIPMVQETEMGNIVDVWTTPNSSVQVPMPLCPYHLIWASEGFIVFVDKGNNQGYASIPNSPKVKEMENATDEEIKKAIEDCKGKKEYSKGIRLAKTILKAREFERGMQEAQAKKETGK